MLELDGSRRRNRLPFVRIGSNYARICDPALAKDHGRLEAELRVAKRVILPYFSILMRTVRKPGGSRIEDLANTATASPSRESRGHWVDLGCGSGGRRYSESVATSPSSR